MVISKENARGSKFDFESGFEESNAFQIRVEAQQGLKTGGP